MKRFTYVAAALASLMVIGCSEKNNVEPEIGGGNKINLTIQVDEPATRAAFGQGADPGLVWTGDETLSLLVGKAKGTNETTEGVTTNAEGGLQITLNSVPGAPGKFSGQVDLGTFTVEDIHGVVIPAENGAYFGYNNNQDRINMKVAAEQTQSVSGVFNPAHCPFFSELNSLGTPDAEGNYEISGLTLYSGVDMYQLNVYGNHPSMDNTEIIKSVKLSADNKIVGESRWNLGQTTTGVGTAGGNDVTVKFEGAETIADKTQATGVKLYSAVAINGGRNITSIEIVTDKAVYTKATAIAHPKVKDVTTLSVFRLDLDLTTFNRVGDKVLLYSADAGATWTSSVPAGETISVKAEEGTPLTAQDLNRIKAAISAKTSPVALDLSSAEYESVTFPAAFAGTEAAPNTYLKGMKFPSNVTEIAASAFTYCSAMTSVDLTGIKTINDSAFRYCGLQTLNIPNTVSFYGTYVFAENPTLKSVYYNSTHPGGPDNITANNKFMFRLQYSSVDTPSLVVTIGPDVENVPRCCFRNNASLTKVIVEGTTNFRQYSLHDCPNLAVIQFLSEDVENLSKVGFGSVFATDEEKSGRNLDASQRKIIVPVGMKDLYTAEIRDEWFNAGYTVVEAAAE